MFDSKKMISCGLSNSHHFLHHKMKTLSLQCPQFSLPRHTIISAQAPTKFRITSSARNSITGNLQKVSTFPRKTLSLSAEPIESQPEIPQDTEDSLGGHSRTLVLGAVSLGLVALLLGFDDQHKALALGPEGPLVEEFWDNVRRYALYALTVSTGAIYTVVQPIFELLKNPISAILILLILGGSLYILSQVLSAMVGVTEFSYDYGY